MILIGLILVIAGAAFGIDVAVKNRFSVRDIEAFGSTLGLHHAEQIFILGAITGAVILFGLALMVTGLVRSRSKNVAHRRQRREGAETDRRAADLDAENQRLRGAAEEQQVPDREADEVTAGDPRGTRVSTGSNGATALDREA
jgi:hypothetical protein